MADFTTMRAHALPADAEHLLRAARAQGREHLDTKEARRYADLLGELREIEDEQARTNTARGTVTALQQRIDANTAKRTLADHHLVYRRGGRHSWIQDLIKHSLNLDDTGEARRRLGQHAHEVATDPSYLEHRDLSRIEGQGGYAVPPAFLLDEYVELARPSRALADLCQQQPLVPGTDRVQVPKILTGTKTGIQTANNTPVVDVDLTDTFCAADVRTIAGQQGLALQLIDQSPLNFDEIVFRDLIADYAQRVNEQVMTGTGTAGQVLGVNFTPGIQTITLSGPPSVQTLYSAIANAIQLIHTTRFLPPTAIVMHPRRWGWCLSLLDSSQRPLFIPTTQYPANAAGVQTAVASQQVVGTCAGLPIVTDPGVTTTAGGGTGMGTEDIIYVARFSDLILYESAIRARILPEPKAQTLTVLCQVYGYLAFLGSRFPQSVCIIEGLTEPSF